MSQNRTVSFEGRLGLDQHKYFDAYLIPSTRAFFAFPFHVMLHILPTKQIKEIGTTT